MIVVKLNGDINIYFIKIVIIIMKHLKKFNESWFSNLMGKKDDRTPDPERLKKAAQEREKQKENKLKEEADKKFPKVISKLNSMLNKTDKGEIKVDQNPTFKTKSTNSVNSFLMDKVKEYYNDLGFVVNHSYDGSYNAKYDWFKVRYPIDPSDYPLS